MSPPSETGSRLSVLWYAHGDVKMPSSRERLFKLLPLLRDRGIDAVTAPLERSIGARSLLKDLRLVKQADVIFIQKRLMLPHFLALLRKLRPVIYDFDDAMYAPWPRFEGPPGSAAVQVSRYRWLATLKAASLVIAGNAELARAAARHSRAVRIIPTSMVHYPSTKQHADTGDITIGWIGTEGNLGYLERLPSILHRLNERLQRPARLKIVCSRPAPFDSPYIDFKPWSLEHEPADLLRFDIGIMPLVDNAWTRGKCGFKLLQYAAAGLPVVASPVGANRDIVRQGESGFLAGADEEWVRALGQLATDVALRRSMGEAGLEHARRKYSPEASADSVADAIRSVVQAGTRARAGLVG